MTSQTAPTLTKDDLPIWMRRSMHGNDYGAWLVLLFTLVIAWFFLVGPHLPASNQSLQHTYRVTNYADALREGRLYPRWDPYANAGYGAPIPHFAAPAAHYIAAILDVFITNDPVTAVRYTFTIGLLLTAGGTYGLVVRIRGAGAAVLAALLAITAPYVGLTSPHVLGDLPGTLALGLFAMLLWAVHRLMTVNYPHDFALVTILATLLVLTDPVIALASGFIAAGLMTWLAAAGYSERFALTTLALLVSGLLSSFFWWPAIAEGGVVQWVTHIPTTRVTFMTFYGLFAPFQQVAPSAFAPEPPLMMGYLHLSFGAFALVFLLWRRLIWSIDALFLATSVLALGVGLTLFPTQIWLLGIAAICLSIASSIALQWRMFFPLPAQRWLLMSLLMITLGASAPVWLPPSPTQIITTASPTAQLQHELSGYGAASVPAGQRYASTISPNTPVNLALVNSIQQGNPNRIETASIAPDVRVATLREASHSRQYQVAATGSSILQIRQAFFPGWSASLANGRNLNTAPTADGLLEIAVPRAEEQVLNIWLGTTDKPRGSSNVGC
ncbi:MAG: hypothetical protein AAF125_13960, partial [Chloroflexota bacterium]